MLTIAYITNRQNPRFHWFAQSLQKQLVSSDDISLLVVDYWAQVVPQDQWTLEHVNARKKAFAKFWPYHLKHIPPKPTFWNGPHRLTKRNYFTAANTRNTAICCTSGEWLAFVDDLSILLPGWLNCVREAMKDNNCVTLGAYKKVSNLVVDKGVIQSCVEHQKGTDRRWLSCGNVQDYKEITREVDTIDSRWNSGNSSSPVTAGGSWMFGCSNVVPIEAYLKVNGYDEDADTIGGEDYMCGMMMEYAGYRFKYDRRMVTYEDDEAHGEEVPFLRIIKPFPGQTDSSHEILHQVQDRRKSVARNYMPNSSLREVRQQILNGAKFELPIGPKTHWPDNQKLEDM